MSKAKPKKKKLGRPLKPLDERLTEQLNVRVTKTERAEMEAEAKRLGTSISQLLMRPWRKGKKRGK